MKLADDLTCAELVELVTGYLDGALSARDRERFEEHLVLCRGCDIHLSQMRATLGAVGRLTEHVVGPSSAGTPTRSNWTSLRARPARCAADESSSRGGCGPPPGGRPHLGSSSAAPPRPRGRSSPKSSPTVAITRGLSPSRAML